MIEILYKNTAIFKHFPKSDFRRSWEVVNSSRSDDLINR